MLFATASGGQMLFFLMVVIPLALHGFRKMGRWFDPKGEIKDEARRSVLDRIKRWPW
jgi:hypothetical protein